MQFSHLCMCDKVNFPFTLYHVLKASGVSASTAYFIHSVREGICIHIYICMTVAPVEIYIYVCRYAVCACAFLFSCSLTSNMSKFVFVFYFQMKLLVQHQRL